jgi:hypothetical protein
MGERMSVLRTLQGPRPRADRDVVSGTRGLHLLRAALEEGAAGVLL